MAVRKAQLVMEIDASGMKRGADEATTSIRRVETASAGAARVVAEHNRSVDKLWRDIEEGERRRAHVLDQSSTRVVKSSEEMKRSMLSVDSVADTLAKRMATLTKAGLSLFSVDLLSRAVGLGSAMEAISNASKEIGDNINEKLFPGLAAAQEYTSKIADDLKRAREELSNLDNPLAGTFQGGGGSIQLRANLSGLRDDPYRREIALKYLNERNAFLDSNTDARAYFSPARDREESALLDLLTRLNKESAADRSARERDPYKGAFTAPLPPNYVSFDDISKLGAIYNASSEASQFDSNTARTSLADIPIARGLFGPTEGESSRFGIASGYTGNPWAGFGFPPYNGDRRGSIAASRGGRAQAGLEGYLYELESSRYTLPVDDPLPESSAYRDVMERVRQRDLERRGRIGGILSGDGFTGFGFGENEQTAMLSRRLGEDISHGIGEGIRTGDWGDAGRSIVQSIQSSLIQSLVAEPFADAAASLIQQLLAGMRGISLGSSGASPRQGAQDRARGLELP